MSQQQNTLENHIVVLGWDQFSYGLVDQLLAADNQIAVVTASTDAKQVINETFGTEVRVVVNPVMDVTHLEDVRIEQCKKVFVNLTSDNESLVAVLNLQAEYGADLSIDVVIENPSLQDTFYVAGANYAVSPESLSSNVIASHIYEEDVGRFTSEFLHATESENDCEFQQYRILEENKYCGSDYETVFWDLKKEFNCVVVGLSKRVDGERTLQKAPDWETSVNEGDYVVLMTPGTAEDDLIELFGVDEGTAR